MRAVLQVDYQIVVDDIDERVLERLVDELLLGELENERELHLFRADCCVLFVEIGDIEDLEDMWYDWYEDFGGV